MKKFIPIAAFLIVIAGFLWKTGKQDREHRLNVLVFSHCSLRWDFLSPWGGKPDWAPNINEFAQNSLVVKNAVSDRSWSNVAGFLKSITKEDFENWGYTPAGVPWDDFLLKPMALDSKNLPPLFYQKLPRRELPSRDKNFLSDLKGLEAKVKGLPRRPFFLEVHSKFMHLPWGISNDLGTPRTWWSPETKALWERYTSAPGKYLKRLPMLILLSPPGRVFPEARHHPLVAAAIRAGTFDPDNPIVNWIGWLQDPRILQEWRKQPDWPRDVALLREMYASRLKTYDTLIAPVLNLWGDEALQRDTVMIFTGDHGESFGEHTGLAHGEEVTDEMIRFPLLVRFPDGKVGGFVTRQIYQSAIRDLVQGIMNGKVNSGNVKDFFEARTEDDKVFVRDCSGAKQALRWKNEWKLVHNEAAGEWKLYDLKGTDPESQDLAEQHPHVVAKMREMMLSGPRQDPNPMGENCGALSE